MTERGITLTFASGARVDLLDEEAAWLRDELVRGEYTSPKRDAGTVVDRALGAIDEDTEPARADMTPANVVELAWALRGMLDHDSEDDGENAGFQEPANLAAELYLDELDESLADNLWERLAALERAEQRLAAGTYGLSIESGEPIPDERLEAIPTAERTVEEERALIGAREI